MQNQPHPFWAMPYFDAKPSAVRLRAVVNLGALLVWMALKSLGWNLLLCRIKSKYGIILTLSPSPPIPLSLRGGVILGLWAPCWQASVKCHPSGRNQCFEQLISNCLVVALPLLKLK